MSQKTFINVQDEVEYILSMYNEDNIVAIPPDVDELTDEEEIDDSIAGKIEVIQADVECDQMPSTSERQTKRLKTEERKVVWEKKIPNYTKWSEAEETYKDCLIELKNDMRNSSPVDMFEKLFSEEVLNLIAVETIRYAKNVKNDQDFNVDAEDIKIFIGFLILSGYHTLPSERDYWSEAEDLGISLVQNAFSRNAYLKIKSYIHFQDNSKTFENRNDKSFKIRPLLEKVNENFSLWGIFDKCLSIDDMIVRYYGQHSLKQSIKGKPIRFGYKFWSMCGDSGYCYKFSLYCGKESSENSAEGSLEERIVMNMLSIVENPSSHVIYFNDFFTSHHLLRDLQENGFRATGAIREGRTEKCPITSTKELDRMERGTFDFRFDEENEITIVRWKDNKSVTVATNFHNIECTSKVQRWSCEKKEKVTIPQPNMIHAYNKHMGGVDHHNRLLEKHSIAIKGKKWYWCLFTRIIDMALVNASILYRYSHDSDSMTMIDFRREVAVKYLKLGIGKKVLQGRPYSLPSSLKRGVMGDVRYDRIDHNIGRRNSQRRCRYEGCQARPLTYCVKCNVTLCKNCFSKFHTKL